MTAAAPMLTHVTPDDPEYIRLSREEAAFWSSDRVGFCQLVDQLGESVWELATNRRFTGNEHLHWYETIAQRGVFRRGLFLGTSGLTQDARILETNPQLHATFCDIAESSLDRWQAELGSRFPGRVEIQATDLNFVELAEATYDLVVSSSTMHHIINLERVASQINKALTPGGLFVLQDFVAETFHRFSAEKKRVFELLYARDVARQGGRRNAGLIWNNEERSRFSPFCGIRSGDILRVFGEELDQMEVHTAGTISGLLLYATPADGASLTRAHRLRKGIAAWSRRVIPGSQQRLRSTGLSEEYVQELLLADDVLGDSGLLAPLNAFAVYGKRA